MCDTPRLTPPNIPLGRDFESGSKCKTRSCVFRLKHTNKSGSWGAPSNNCPIAEMPPSINSEILERNPSSDSLHSSPFQTMRKNSETQQSFASGSMTSTPKSLSKYRPYGEDSDVEDDGCGEIALFERPSWSESLRRQEIHHYLHAPTSESLSPRSLSLCLLGCSQTLRMRRPS